MRARARSVLLAALSILPYSAVDAARSEAEAELEKDRSMRVANLLGFSVVRSSAHVYLPKEKVGHHTATSSAQCAAHSCIAFAGHMHHANLHEGSVLELTAMR